MIKMKRMDGSIITFFSYTSWNQGIKSSFFELLHNLKSVINCVINTNTRVNKHTHTRNMNFVLSSAYSWHLQIGFVQYKSHHKHPCAKGESTFNSHIHTLATHYLHPHSPISHQIWICMFFGDLILFSTIL